MRFHSMGAASSDRSSNRALAGFAFIGPAATALAITIISFVVYLQVSAGMVSKTEETLSANLQSVDLTILNIFQSAAKGANLLLFNVSSPSAGDALRPDVAAVAADSLKQLETDIPSCNRMWIRFANGRVIYGPTTSALYTGRNGWWKRYQARDLSAQTTLFTAQDSAGAIGAPFRDELNLDTIVPVIVYHFHDQALQATAFAEIDITQLLNTYSLEFSATLGHQPAQVDISIFGSDGALVETTRNLPLMNVQPLSQSTGLSLSAQQFETLRNQNHVAVVNSRYVEIYGWDHHTGLVFDARVSRATINGGIARITLSILGIGLLSVIGIILFGLFLVRAIARTKSFEEQQVRSRLEMLQAKMHPHFLFNTLDSMVSVAARNDRDTLLRMLRSLSYMLHVSLRKKEDIVTLEEELEYVSSYVQLQNVRNPDGFEFRVDVDDELLDVLVYRFCIQPLVENCFVHGVDRAPGGNVAISVTARRGENGVEVVVADDGPGCDPSTAERLRRVFQHSDTTDPGAVHNHIGLAAVHSRLRTLHGPRYGLTLLPTSKGFSVRATLPPISEPVRFSPGRAPAFGPLKQ